MLIRTVSLAFAILGALMGAQLPEIMHQYYQRLGGAIDELTAIVERFDVDAEANGLNRKDAVTALQLSSSDLVRRRGIDMEFTIDRLALLVQQRKEMGRDYLSRTFYFLAHADGIIVEKTLEDYRPAIPTTSEGLISAFTGFVAGWWIIRLVAWPFLRWKETRARSGQFHSQ